jgi:hypothetical protein
MPLTLIYGLSMAGRVPYMNILGIVQFGRHKFGGERD